MFFLHVLHYEVLVQAVLFLVPVQELEHSILISHVIVNVQYLVLDVLRDHVQLADSQQVLLYFRLVLQDN